MLPLISTRVNLLQAKRREIRAKIHRTLIVALIAPLFVTISAPPSLGLPNTPSSTPNPASNSTSKSQEVPSPFTSFASLKSSAPITQGANLNTTGLVARFDAKTYASYAGTGTTWNDISGNGLSAAFTNKTSPLTSDYISGGITFKGIGFDGVNQFATINSNFSGAFTGLSISFYANLGAATNFERIVDIGDGAGNKNIVIARNGTTQSLVLALFNGTTSEGFCQADSALDNNTWAHWAFVVDGSTCKVYKNGAAFNNLTNTKTNVSSTSGSVAYTGLPENTTRANAYIGKSNWASDVLFEGAIADLAIFNRALTPTDVVQWREDQMSSTVHAGAGVCPNRVANPAAVTVTSVGGDCVVRFSAPSNTTTANTWIVPSGVTTAKVLMVAGGGGGGAHVGGGGGAGGFIESTTAVSATTAIAISVGAGGAGTSYPNAVFTAGAAGANSVFGSSFTALGGGRGASWTTVDKTAGGSGGGSSSTGSSYPTGGLATNAAQGFAGGSSLSGCGSTYGYPTGGGGGAGGVGASATCLTDSTGKAGDGGIGKISDVTGTATYYAGGGGGGIHGEGTYLGIVGNGGLGGGGKGIGHGRVNTPGTYTGTAGTDGLGGGGGGSGAPGANTYTSTGGRGGSGVVIIRYGTTTLSINSNGGSGFTGTTSFSGTTFTNITLPAQSGLSRSGFTFGGWNTAANGSGTNYAAGSVYQLNIATTLFAQWRSIISYDANGGTSTRTIDSTTALGSGASTTLSTGVTSSGSVVTSGLQLHLDASNPASYPGTGSTWFDISGNGRNATALNSPTFDPVSKSFVLNGTNQGFEFAATNFAYSGTSPYTLAAMFKSSNIGKAEQCLICRWQNNVAGSYLLRALNGVPESYRAGVASYPATGYLIGSSEYQYLVTTYDGSITRIYLDGVQIFSATNVTGNNASSTVKTTIGASADSTRHLEGQIFSAQIYNVALTAAQVNQNYNSLLPRALITKDSSTLSGWSTTTDSSTSVIVGNSGTLLAGLPTPYIRLEAKNYDGTTWTPTNYNGNGITFSEVKPTKNNSQTGWGAAATFPTVSGLAANSVAIYLNNPVLESYTFCGMARYKTNGIAAPATMGRIFTGTSVDWLAGWYNSNTKDFYHTNGYLNNSTTVDYDWHYLCDSGNNIYWDGVKLPVTNQTYTKLPTIALGGAYANVHWSDFEISEVIIYDQFLSASQIAQVNQYFKSTYGMVAGAVETATPNMVPPTNFASTGTSTLYARWGSTITYDGNGQTSGTPPTPQVFANGVGTLATNSGSLAKAGYNFAGWNTRADGTGTLYAAGSSYSGSNLLLYAIYQVAVKFTNTFAAAEPITLAPYMRFRASDYDASKKIWYDSSGNGRNTSYIRGAPTVTTATIGNGVTKTFTTVQGGTGDGVQFKNPARSTDGWTMFSVARYNGTQSGNSRLFDGETDNFIFGFYLNRSGVAHYNNNGWLPTNGVITPDSYGQNWVVSSGYTDTYRGNGYAGTATNPLVRISRNVGDAFPAMTINAGQLIGTEPSTWQVAEAIIFDRKLSISEIEKIEDYLATTYGIQNYLRQSTYSESVTVNAAAGQVTLSDTYTASFGYRNTFSVSPTIPGITMENTVTNNVRIRVASTVAAGTYWETITATDAVGNTALLPFRINVFPQVVWSPSNATSVQTTYGKQSRIRLDFTDGGNNKRVTLTHVSNPSSAAITIDTSTISSGFVTVLVDTSTAIGSYQESVTITDSSGVIKSTVLSITVNKQATIAYPTASSVPSISRNGLIVRYEMDSATSYSGTGTTITDLQGRSNGIINGSTAFSRDFNGNVPLTGTQYIHMATGFNSSIIGETISAFMWVQPTGNGILLDERGQVGTGGVVSDGWRWAHIEVVTGAFKFRNYNGDTLTYTPPGGTALNTGWYYVGYTYNKSTSTLTAYVNGVAVATQTSFDRFAPYENGNIQYFGIGLADSANMGNGSNGSFKFGAFHLYNTALSTTEVLNNYLVSKGRYTYLPSAGVLNLTTTAGINKDFSIFTGLDGVGNKTFTLSGLNSNFALETSTSNIATFKVLSTTAATSASSARTYSETLTATDINGLNTTYSLTITANPVLLITTTSDTVTTTFGRTGSSTLNVAVNTGTGSSTFSRVSSSSSSAITATFTSGQAVLSVAATLPAGTYYETLTATDSLGATAFKVITIVVNAAMAIVPSTGSTTFETTFTRATTARLNITGGTGNRTYAITYPSSASRWRISLDTSTAASNFVTVRVDSFTATGTHSITVTVTDSLSATASTTLTLNVNEFPILNNVRNENTYTKLGLILNLDAANTLSSTGANNWKDLSGAGSSAIFTSAPTYSTANGGIFTFNGSTNYLTLSSITTATSPGVTGNAFPEYTAESWVRFNYPSFSSFTGTACLICEAYIGTSGSMNLALSIRGNGQIHSGYLPTTAINWVETTTAVGTVTTGIWYHIAATVVKSGINYINTIYLNGVAITSSSSTHAPATSSRDYYIGRRWDSASQLLNGSVGVVRVYNRGLTQSEIQDNYNALVPRYINTSARSSTFTTTQGVSASSSSIPATLGTGNKTLTLASVIAGISGDTSTANAIRVNSASTLAATDTQTARTYVETITATDTAGAAVTHLVNVTVNPPIILAANSTSIATTSGVETSTVVTASRGSSVVTFTRTGTSTSGITLTAVGNQATLRVLSTINPGTYFETVTATDTASATTSMIFTIVVAPPPSLLGVSRIETSKGVLFTTPVYAISGGTGTLTMSVTNSPSNANISLTGVTSLGGFLQVGAASETGTYTSTIRVTDARGAFSEIAVTVIVNAPVTLSGALSITKTYGNATTNGYSTNGTGTAPFSFSATPVCAVVRTVSGSFTFERINGTDSCTWTAPIGVTAVDALLVGGGGGGGGDGGSGGGGGSINAITSASLPANRQLTVQIGTGGTGGVWGGDGATAGGTTSITSGSTAYTAPGGAGGGGCGAAASAGGVIGSGGSGSAGGAGGFGGTGTGCGAGVGGVGSNGPSSSFTGSAVTYGGGGGGGPLPDTTASAGGKVGGTGGGGTGTTAKGNPAIGLSQYFRTFSTTPDNANTKPSFILGTCAVTTGNINYSTDSEFPCAQKDNFQVYAEGYFVAPITGSITFRLNSDDSSHFAITVNGSTQEFSADNSANTASYSGFVQNQQYPIRVFFTERGGLARWQLEYNVGQGLVAIPSVQLRPASEGLNQYFRYNSSSDLASTKPVFTTGTCGERIGNINYANDAAFPCTTKENFQGYATGFFVAPYTGDIKFYLNSDDSSYLSINVNGTNREFGTTIGDVNATYSGFVKGQYYAISVFFKEISGAAVWKLDYEYTGQARTAIPDTYLRPANEFTVPTAGTNGLGGGGGGGSAGLYKINGALGGSGTAIIKYLTQSETATAAMITAVVEISTPTGLVTLNVPANVTVGTYTQVIKVQDAANSAPYSATVTIVVNKATPTATISLPGSVTTATYGTPVTLSVRASTPGNVAFKKSGSALTGCSSVATSNGVASCSWTPSVIETASIMALLTPTDSINYNSSVETASALSIVVGKADTLTVIAGNITTTYSEDGSGNPNTTVASPTFTLNGLAAIDSITAMSYAYTGTQNNGSNYASNPTSPKVAGTYSITPSTPVFTSPGTVNNYRHVTFTPGTLTINRKGRGAWTATYGAGTNIITYGASKQETPTVTYPGDGTRSFTTTSSVCSVNASTGVITTLGVGACDVTAVLSQTANWLSDTLTATVTINRGPRVATVTPASSTIRYGETTTVTSTVTQALDSATVTFSAGSFLGCAVDNVTGEVTGIRAGASCAVSVTYAQTALYESATASAAMTINKALAPVVTTETITAISYTGNTALVTPRYRVSGILARDILQVVPVADVSNISLIDPATYSTVASYKYFATNPSSYDSTTAPSQGGTYAVTAQTLTLLSGVNISNYETPTYVSSNLVINPIIQAALRILLSAQESITVPYDITFAGGSSTGLITAAVISGGSATGCSVSGLRLSTSTAGTCILQATKAADRNYLQVISETATVTILNFVSYIDFNALFDRGSGITITSQVPITLGAHICREDCVPEITDIQDIGGNSTTTLTVLAPLRLIGVDLNTTDRVLFTARINGVRMSNVPAGSFQVDSPTQITVMPPASFVPNTGENSSSISVRIIVYSSGGSISTEKIVIISL